MRGILIILYDFLLIYVIIIKNKRWEKVGMGEINQLQEEYSNLKSQRDEMADEVDELKGKERKLSYAIEEEKSSIEQIKNSIETLQETLSDLRNLLEIHENEMPFVSEELESKNKELSEIEQKLIDKKKQLDIIKNSEICQKALEANANNSYVVSLRKSTATTPIITEYCKSDKEFMDTCRRALSNEANRMFHKLYDDFSNHSSLAPARDKHITNFPYIAHVSPGTRVLDAFQFTVTFEQQFDVALFVIKLLDKSDTFLFFIGKLSKQSNIFTIPILQLLLKPLLPVIM